MLNRKKWARAVFTVEAAVIIPLSITMIALLIGYCFFVHQSGWLKGAAYEAALKGVEKGQNGNKEEAVKKRMDARISEIPILTGQIDTGISAGQRVRLSWHGTVLQEVFGERFRYGGEAVITDFDPMKVKRLEFLISSFKGQEE